MLEYSRQTWLKGTCLCAPHAVFTVGGRKIDNVEKWSHLGHIINTNFNDNDDTESRRNSYIGQVNKVLVHFSKLDPFVKT